MSSAAARATLPPMHPMVHLGIFAACAAIVALSMLLQPTSEAVLLFGVEVPPLCMWKNLTGQDCLGCGLTRSFTYMGHGEIAHAFDLHKLGPVFFAFVAAQLPWRLGRLVAWGLTKRG